MADDQELIEALRKAQSASRGYADWDAWPDSDARDLGIGQDFARALLRLDGVGSA